MLFGIMAIQIKRKAPNCHTILEVVRLRWGKAAHLVRQYSHRVHKPSHCWNLCSRVSIFSGNFVSIRCSSGAAR